jgi:hypothetical protein
VIFCDICSRKLFPLNKGNILYCYDGHAWEKVPEMGVILNLRRREDFDLSHQEVSAELKRLRFPQR